MGVNDYQYIFIIPYISENVKCFHFYFFILSKAIAAKLILLTKNRSSVIIIFVYLLVIPIDLCINYHSKGVLNIISKSKNKIYEKPFVSIIVPVYKTEYSRLNRCIESLIEQTLKEIEIILIDDGSPDKCGKICDEYADKDERITVIHQENSGVSAARNAGIAVAAGRYIGFTDADDHVMPDMFEKMYNSVSENNSQLISTGYKNESNGSVSDVIPGEEKKILNKNQAMKEFLLCRKIDFHVWNKLFLRETLDEICFDTDIAIGEDELFIYNFLKKCTSVVYNPLALYFYSSNDSSVMHLKFSRKNLDALIVASKISDDLKSMGFDISKTLTDFFYVNIALRIWLKIQSNTDTAKEYSFVCSKINVRFNDISSRALKEYSNKIISFFFFPVKHFPKLTAFIIKNIKPIQKLIKL